MTIIKRNFHLLAVFLLAISLQVTVACQETTRNNVPLHSETTTLPTLVSPTKTPVATLVVTMEYPLAMPSESIATPQAVSGLTGKMILNQTYGKLTSILFDIDDDNQVVISVPEEYAEYARIGFASRTHSYSPNFTNFVWSNSGGEVAFPCLSNHETQICVWETTYLEKENILQGFQHYTLVPAFENYYPAGNIDNISWSSDDQLILVNLHSRYGETVDIDVESPCLVNRSDNDVLCGVNNVFGDGFSEVEKQTIAGATALVWSSSHQDSLAFSASEGLSIYLVNLQTKEITELWRASVESKIDITQSLVWSSSGDKISFVLLSEIEKKPSGIYLGKYTVTTVDLEGDNFTTVFSSDDVYSQIKDFIPTPFENDTPRIYLSSWSNDDQFLLFEVGLGDNPYQDNLLGIFLYDTKKDEILMVQDFMVNSGDFRVHRLHPDWTQ